MPEPEATLHGVKRGGGGFYLDVYVAGGVHIQRVKLPLTRGRAVWNIGQVQGGGRPGDLREVLAYRDERTTPPRAAKTSPPSHCLHLLVQTIQVWYQERISGSLQENHTMTVAADRTINNNTDTGRRSPVTALGLQLVQVQGPASSGTRILPTGINAIALIQAYVTATGAAGGVPAPVEGTHWTQRTLADGTTELTEAAAVNRSTETWNIWVDRGTVGGQSVVTP